MIKLQCFVIQPFDSGKFDKRFEDVYRLAIEDAGLEAYRVDRDPTAEVPIESIERGIKRAAVCLADITVDNPNVWYELGFAYAIGKPVVLVCSAERTGKRFPFDIQHRAILEYSPDAPSDFEQLREGITSRIKAFLNKDAAMRQMAAVEQVAAVEGLSQPELIVLAAVSGNAPLPNNTASLYYIQREAEQVGLTSIGFALGIRRLRAKAFIEVSQEVDDRGDEYAVVSITDLGWTWIENNEDRFLIKREITDNSSIDDVPF